MQPDIATILCFIVLGMIAIVDLRTRKIPDALLLLLIAFGTFRISLLAESLLISLLSMLAVGVPFLLIATWSGSDIGGGDVKLIAVTSYCFGILAALSALLFTITLMLIVSRIKRTNKLPMAPYFAVCSLLLLI